YSNHVGETFDVVRYGSDYVLAEDYGRGQTSDAPWRHIRTGDAEIVGQPMDGDADRKWDALFADSQDFLEEMADRAIEEWHRGQPADGDDYTWEEPAAEVAEADIAAAM